MMSPHILREWGIQVRNKKLWVIYLIICILVCISSYLLVLESELSKFSPLLHRKSLSSCRSGLGWQRRARCSRGWMLGRENEQGRRTPGMLHVRPWTLGRENEQSRQLALPLRAPIRGGTDRQQARKQAWIALSFSNKWAGPFSKAWPCSTQTPSKAKLQICPITRRALFVKKATPRQ